MSTKKILVWNPQIDELLCREMFLFEPCKFKARTREKCNARKAIAENFNLLDGFKVDARSVRKRYDNIKSNFQAKQRDEQRASGISPDVTPLDTALEELIEREKESVKTFEDKDKKNKEDQELARSIRQEAVETFQETGLRKLEQTADNGVVKASVKKKPRSSGSETLACLKEKIEKERVFFI